MKATVWLCATLSFICVTILHASAFLNIMDTSPTSNVNRDDYFLDYKRTKPSLSIVNPLDVLRQRLLLEIARRQMKENTRQVEINRAILKNVGKRNNLGRQRSNEETRISFLQQSNFEHDQNIKKQQKLLNPKNFANFLTNSVQNPSKKSDEDDYRSENKLLDDNDDDYQLKFYHLEKDRYVKE